MSPTEIAKYIELRMKLLRMERSGFDVFSELCGIIFRSM